MRITARSAVRTTVVAIMTAFVALILGVTQTLTTAITASIGLTAVRALIVPGTGTSNPAVVENYMQNAVNNYLIPGGVCDATCFSSTPPPNDGSPVPVPYIAQFWPIPGWGGLQGAKWNVSVASGVESLNNVYDQQLSNFPPEENSITIFGYSQGATVATLFKTSLDNPDNADNLNFFFIGDPQRANGGFFERLAFLGNVPVLDAQFGRPATTDDCLHSNGDPCATDFAFTYDGVVDSPQWLLNLPAVLNAAAGLVYEHGTYLSPDDGEPADAHPYGYTVTEVQDAIDAAEADCSAATYCQMHGDTRYITLPARYLPIYQPLIDLGDATGTSALVVPIVDLVSPFTQTIIETAYDRTDYSKPTPGTLLPPANFSPFQVAVDLVNDIPEGINMALEPGRTPLPGSPPLPTATTLTDTNKDVVKSPKLFDGKPLTRLSLFAKPNEGITATGTEGTDAERPSLRGALGDVHPVRDAVKAVSGAVKKVLGKEDAGAPAASDSEN